MLQHAHQHLLCVAISLLFCFSVDQVDSGATVTSPWVAPVILLNFQG